MGQVFLGVSPGGRRVAVKVIRPELAADPEFLRRFAREVDAASRVGGFSLLFAFKETDSTSSLAFSPNGRELALGNAYLNSVRATYTDLRDQLKFLGAFSASTKDILSVQFLSNDSLLAAGSDSTVRFWDVPAGTFTTVTTPAQSIATHWGQASAMSYSAQLGLVVTGSPSGSRVWETDPGRVAANICQTLKAPVRPILWKEYLPDIPYTPVCG